MTLLHRHGLKAYSDAGAGYGDDFVIVVETTADNETFTCPFLDTGTYNANVDWGDSTNSTITAYNDADGVHTYADSGEHTIRISGTCPGWGFANGGDRLKIVAVLQFGDVGWLSFANGFYGCSNIVVAASGSCNTVAVTNMVNMFRACSSLTALDVSGLDTSSVTDMGSMFRACSSLTALDVSGFDTAAVTYMGSMFFGCSSLTALDVSGFDTAAVTNTSYMFSGCSSLTALDVSGFDTSSISGMFRMFYASSNVTSESMDGFLSALYNSRMSTTWATPAVDISPCNAPSGVYQDATPPTTGEEFRYKLENDPDAEGFNTWAITV